MTIRVNKERDGKVAPSRWSHAKPAERDGEPSHPARALMEQASLINTENDEPAPSAATAHAEPQRPVRVVVSELLAGGREAILVHDGQDYRLRITANGKLILTK
jgi:hemin uptake protein HemP